ncbi:hypothetical protein DY000_02007576 [Brassica cretica]|uniref:Uncharacterized protein n=1 Tax=Brassica cretica TaxID=69181 RepID=A0ABQ7C761_BRACR|nr:hypothetical protein DY000_02007576 [Brassica cretica]
MRTRLISEVRYFVDDLFLERYRGCPGPGDSVRNKGSLLGAQRLLLGLKRWAQNPGVLGWNTDSWSLEIDLITRRLREDPEVIWGPEGRGGPRRVSLDPEISFGARRSFSRSWDHDWSPEAIRRSYQDCWGKIFHEEIIPASGFKVPSSRFRVPAPGSGSLPPGPLLGHAYARLILAITINEMKIYAHCSTSTTRLTGSGHDLQLISRVPPCSLKHIDTSCSLQHIDRSTICSGHVTSRTNDSYQLQSPVLPRLRAY